MAYGGSLHSKVSRGNLNDRETIKRRKFAQRMLQLVKPGGTLKMTEADKAVEHAIHIHHSPKEPIAWKNWMKSARTGLNLEESLKKMLTAESELVPSVENSLECRCTLTVKDYGYHFQEKSIDAFMTLLFILIKQSASPKVSLNRFDLFHAHLFTSYHRNEIGVLFHTSEYPAKSESFQTNLGYCQVGSTLTYDPRSMNFRNWLYFRGRLVCLDLSESSILHKKLLMKGLEPVRTVLESDLGRPLCEINYFPSVEGKKIESCLFVCPLHW